MMFFEPARGYRGGLLLVLALSATAACEASTRGEQASGTVTISVVSTNDVHGGLLPREGRGGVETLSGYVTNLRETRKRDGGVLLVDAGDMFQGTVESNLAEGAPVVAAYNVLGYAAAAIGNHEFDFGVAGPGVAPAHSSADLRGALKARAAEARFPFLAANLIDSASGRPVDWPNVRPAVTVDVAGVRVGVIGVMTSGALSATIATTTVGLRIAPLAPTIAREAKSLRQAGADVVVVAAHAGGRCTRFDNPKDLSSCGGEDTEIVRVVHAMPPGTVDLIASGHTHAGMAHEIEGTIVMQAFSGGASFSRADLAIDRATRRVVNKRVFPPRDLCARVYEGTTRCDPAAARGRALVAAEYEGQTIRSDPAIARAIAPAVQRARSHAEERIGVVLETPIRRAPVGTESALGNLFTDAMLDAIRGADVAINNTRGGLRADLPAGPLTFGRLYEVFPFDNRLVRLQLTGAALRRVFETQLQQGRALPGIAGIRVAATCATGRMRLSMVLSSGRPVRDADALTIVTTDFLATGGDRILTPVMPKGGFPVTQDLPIFRDVVAEWLEDHGGRLRADQFIDTAQPRWQYPGQLPVACN
jgi:5'-nucleotidase